MKFRSDLEREIYAHVANCGEDHCACGYVWLQFEEEDALCAAENLVQRGLLIGKFPPNPNRKYGIDWGYLALPRPRPAAQLTDGL